MARAAPASAHVCLSEGARPRRLPHPVRPRAAALEVWRRCFWLLSWELAAFQLAVSAPRRLLGKAANRNEQDAGRCRGSLSGEVGARRARPSLSGRTSAAGRLCARSGAAPVPLPERGPPAGVQRPQVPQGSCYSVQWESLSPAEIQVSLTVCVRSCAVAPPPRVPVWLAHGALLICPGFPRSFYLQEKRPASRASAPAPPSGEALRVVLCGVVPARCAAGCTATSQLQVVVGWLLP